MTLKGVTPHQYERFRDRTDELRFHIGAPAVEGAVLRQLGNPPSWSLRATASELVYPAVARAAKLARRLALSGAKDQ